MPTTIAIIDLSALMKEGARRDLLKRPCDRPSPEQERLMTRYDLTAAEAAFFIAVAADSMEDRNSDLRRLSKRYGVASGDYIELFKLHASLVAKKLLLSPQEEFGKGSTLNPPCLIEDSVLQALVHGEDPAAALDPADPFSLLQEIEGLWNKLDERDISPDRFTSECKRLLGMLAPDNVLRKLTEPLPFVEQIMIVVAAMTLVNAHHNGVELREFAKRLYPKLRERAHFLREVTEGRLTVLGQGVIVLDEESDNPFSVSPDFTLSPKARGRIFGMKKRKQKKAFAVSGTFSHHRWRDKGTELFFDQRLSAELHTVTRALSRTADGHRLFARRLKERGMPSGFTALFYGMPGTGKTAAVHHLARFTRRDVLQVEMAAIRDKWVGESEKRTRAIFTEYHTACESLAVKPILLLNEADALLSRRMDAHTAVETMNNTMQNILLEELEKFDGILIATTNLTGMLDDAFSRRFLYKLEFPQPTPGVRARIWHAKLSELTETEAETLALHPLSGGEIENVTRRYIVDTLFSGKPDIARLEALCREELSLKGGGRKKLGF